MRYWSSVNPREVHQRPLHSDRVTVLCTISRIWINGSYFFAEDDRTATVNSERNVAMIQEFFAPALEELNAGLVWFQQDGAMAHTARKSMAVLREMFPGRLISLRGDISWPARSPDLTSCDYFLWGYLKAEVFKHRPRTPQALKDAICLEVARILHDMLDRVMRNIRIHLQQLIDNNGHHLQDTLFKTMCFKTSHVVVTESKNKIFVSRIVFLLFTLKFRVVILPHSVCTHLHMYACM